MFFKDDAFLYSRNPKTSQHFSTSGSIILEVSGLLLTQSPHISIPTLDFFKLLLVLKKAVTIKCLNGTTEVVRDIKRYHGKQ